MVRLSSGAFRSVGKKTSFGTQISVWLVAAGLCSALGVGCSRKIGDSCRYSTDCSAMGDRICDTTQPDGYCTQFNCEPNTCPAGESVCVSFSDPSCPNLPSSRRFARNFCMKPCSDNGDCRSGYTCREMGNNVVDRDPEKRTVCVVGTDQSSSTPSGVSNAVCEPIDAAMFDDFLNAASDGGSVGADAGM